MILSKKEALHFKALVCNEYPQFANEIDEALFQDSKNQRNIRAWQYCEHKWHKFTKAEINMIGNPKNFNFMKEWDEKTIEEWYMNFAGKCDKCGMPYKYHTLTDEDYEEILEEYNSNVKITLNLYCGGTNDFFEKVYKDRQIEDDMKWLKDYEEKKKPQILKLIKVAKEKGNQEELEKAQNIYLEMERIAENIRKSNNERTT